MGEKGEKKTAGYEEEEEKEEEEQKKKKKNRVLIRIRKRGMKRIDRTNKNWSRNEVINGNNGMLIEAFMIHDTLYQ